MYKQSTKETNSIAMQIEKRSRLANEPQRKNGTRIQ